MSREEDLGEPDRLDGVPHPREQIAFFGHAEGEQAFVDAVAAGRLHHAWLIGGPEGIGKATLAYRVARRLLGLSSDRGLERASLALPPDDRTIRQVAALSHPNLAVLRRAPASDKKGPSVTIPIDAVRRALSMFGSTAAGGGYRVAIVDSAEDLNIPSANALLKVIEEPPPRSVFLIVSHAPQRLMPTIRSRCRSLLLRPLAPEEVRAAVASLGPPWTETEPSLLDQAIRLGEGSVRRTLKMLDADKLRLVSDLTAALDALPRTEPKKVLALAERLYRRDGEEDYELVLDTVERWVGKRLHESAGLGSARLAPLVEVCEKVGRSALEVDVYNLDRRPLVLSLFDDLAEAVRRTA